MKYIFNILFFIFISANSLFAQFANPVTWTFNFEKISNTEYILHFDASIDEGYHLYSTNLPPNGPLPTSVSYENTAGIEFVGDLVPETDPVKVFDNAFGMEVEYFSNNVRFTQKIKVLSDTLRSVDGYVEYMSCDDESCTPPAETVFNFQISEKTTQSQIPAITNPIENTNNGNKSRGLFLFLLVAFLAGLAAIITPCVFPMIPMTVSFFMRGSENRAKSIKTAMFFGFSIVLIYTLLGALFSVGLFGPNAATILSTHWIPNTIFFVLFFIFALSFFGLFELVLPGSLVNKADAKADKGGFIGAFFMALTTVIVSFSCTGPFIGYLIVEAVQGGGLRPMLGMFAFGFAFATPFTLLAIFPSALKKMPKSGGWLNAVKVVFAFILLAFGLKFLSNIDQVYGLNILSREIYLAIWIVIFFMLGLYLLGKIKFSHDSETKHLGVGRLLLSMVVFVFVVYLFTGLWGASLKSISSLLPPQTETYHSQAVVPAYEQNIQTPACGTAKYADKLHMPYQLPGYFDYEQGMACAQEQNKPAFVVFKGHACANCKKMENTVWNQPEVLKMLAEDYVLIALYTDDRTKLPENQWKKSEFDGRTLKTLGKVNLDILLSDYQVNSIPYHVIIMPDGKTSQLEVTYDNDVFLNFIKSGIR